jgi:hypothetical protein
MVNKALIATALAFAASSILLIVVWQYQRRTLNWHPVSIEIISSDVLISRDKQLERALSKTTINYSYGGKHFTQTIRDMPFDTTQVFVDPADPANLVTERGPTLRGLFVPATGIVVSSILGIALILIRLSPPDD